MTEAPAPRRLPWWKWFILIFIVALLVTWLWFTPGGLLGKADAIGYAVCHRISSHSFHLGERPTPVCARCSGMFLGALLGIVFQWRRSPRHGLLPPWYVMLFFGLALGAFAFDGINSYLGFFENLPQVYPSQNWLRLFTGTGVGLGLAGLVYPAFTQSVWADWKPAYALGSLRELGLLAGLAGLVDLMVLSEVPFLLYPLAVLSAAGVLTLLTMVYTMIWIMLLRAENGFTTLRQMWFPLTAGAGMALLQIALIDVMRYLFTGTWGGFNL